MPPRSVHSVAALPRYGPAAADEVGGAIGCDNEAALPSTTDAADAADAAAATAGGKMKARALSSCRSGCARSGARCGGSGAEVGATARCEAGVTVPNLTKFFDTVDRDKDGQVSLVEFREALEIYCGNPLSVQESGFLFQFYDGMAGQRPETGYAETCSR